MKKPKKPGPGNDAPPGNHNDNGRQKGSCGCPSRSGAPSLPKDEKLIDLARQIIAATPEIRPEKVEPLREAVASGTYEIDARKLANCLITKIILES
jgi:flagellar biosynthesis anti-sigma factor FlgM